MGDGIRGGNATVMSHITDLSLDLVNDVILCDVHLGQYLISIIIVSYCIICRMYVL